MYLPLPSNNDVKSGIAIAYFVAGTVVAVTFGLLYGIGLLIVLPAKSLVALATKATTSRNRH